MILIRFLINIHHLFLLITYCQLTHAYVLFLFYNFLCILLVPPEFDRSFYLFLILFYFLSLIIIIRSWMTQLLLIFYRLWLSMLSQLRYPTSIEWWALKMLVPMSIEYILRIFSKIWILYTVSDKVLIIMTYLEGCANVTSSKKI